MFGVTIGVYKNKEVAAMAAKAYALEEGNQWLVVYWTRYTELDPVFRPCRLTDLDQAKEESWEPVY